MNAYLQHALKVSKSETTKNDVESQSTDSH